MRWPRVTIRLLMGLVILAAFGSYVSFTAWDVWHYRDYHVHVYVESVNEGGVMTMNGAASPPFWPRFWRHLLGRPWKGQPVCAKGAGHLEEICALARPDLDLSLPPKAEFEPPPEITAALDRISQEWDRKHPEEARRRDQLLKDAQAGLPDLSEIRPLFPEQSNPPPSKAP